MKLSIIILSYNTASLLKDCLQSVYRSDLPSKDFEVLVIDNASSDNSVSLVKKHFPNATLIQNQTNLGFAKANNIGINKSKSEYILLLNSDTKAQTNSLSNLLKFMDAHPQAGIASAQLLNNDSSIQQSGGHLPRLTNIMAWMLMLDHLPIIKQLFWSYHQTNQNFYKISRRLGWVQGAAMILRRTMLDKIGLLDEKIFMYAEDIDLCLRARQKNWQTWTVSDSKIIHLNFKSSGKENATLGEYQGLKYLFKKHKPAWESPLLRFFLKTGSLLRVFIFGTIFKDKTKYDIYKKAFHLA